MTKIVSAGRLARIALIGEVFNLFNVSNLTGYSGVLNQPGYGQPSARATRTGLRDRRPASCPTGSCPIALRAECGAISGRRRWTVTMTLVCTAAALLASPARAQDRQKAVLTLYATRSNAPATVAVDRAIHRVLETGLQGSVDYYSEQIDLARFPEPDYPAALRQFLRTKYSQQHFDVIIATSVAMLESVTAAGNELFPEVPVVFSGSPKSHAGPRSTGIASSLEFKETLDLQ